MSHNHIRMILFLSKLAHMEKGSWPAAESSTRALDKQPSAHANKQLDGTRATSVRVVSITGEQGRPANEPLLRPGRNARSD